MNETTRQRINRLQGMREKPGKEPVRKPPTVPVIEEVGEWEDREKMISNVINRMEGGKVTNLDRLLERVGDGEEIPDEERSVCQRDLMSVRSYYGIQRPLDSPLRQLEDSQLYWMWRKWLQRERRVVSTSTFAGWLGSTEP